MRKRVPAEVFGKTEEKIDGCFACGYGTILYFEDMAIVRSLQESFPTYKDNFPIWAEQTDAMHQLAVWTMLEDAGMGASLQHYNPGAAYFDTWQWFNLSNLMSAVCHGYVRPV